MNNDQAKEILVLYRPGSADRLEPEVAEALALADRDPDLSRWLEEHCAIQNALQAKFRQIPVPEGLKEQILSERKAHSALPGRRTMVLAAVCGISLLLLIGIAALLLRSREDDTFANFQTRMIGKVARASNYPVMDLETDDSVRIFHYLAQSNAPVSSALPGPLANATPTGCAILQWQGQSVSMICYNSGRDSKKKAPDLFLFVARRRDVPRAPTKSSPSFQQREDLAVASWSSGDENYVYLLAGFGDESFLRKYF